jgi:hypothetical protein
MNQKVKQQRFLKYLWLLHTKKVYIGSFIKARLRIRVRSQASGYESDQKGPDTTGSGSRSAKLLFWYMVFTTCRSTASTLYDIFDIHLALLLENCNHLWFEGKIIKANRSL